MANITLLDQLTIDKIAAGEVVESPTACLKELLENSLDAHASNIIITIERGGRQKIEVHDNGVGMNEEDLKLSIVRHATSKIRTIDDLETLLTLGFRGEALAATASVSKLSIHTASSHNSPVHSSVTSSSILIMEGGSLPRLQVSKREQGTTVTVQDLFYNVPARRKFLKPPVKEVLDIIRVVQSHALSNPTVGFELYIDGAVEIKLPPSSLEERIEILFKIPKKKLIPLVYEGHSSLSGFLFPPELQRTTRLGQFISVNKRPIHTLSLSYAIKAGYGPTIDKDKYPLFAIDLLIDTKVVDVNVHPQKKEVRFSNEEELKELLQTSVMKALFSLPPPQTLPENTITKDTITKDTTTHQVGTNFHREYSYSLPPIMPLEEAIAKAGIATINAEPLLPFSSLTHISSTGALSIFRIGGEWAKRVGEPSGNEVLILIDMRAVLQTLGGHTKEDTSHSSQTLLTPHLLKLNDIEFKTLETMKEQLQSVGYRLNQFGPRSFLVEAVPSTLTECDLDTIFKQLIDGEEVTSTKQPLPKNGVGREALLMQFFDKGLTLRSCKILNEELLLKIIKSM